jgi:hypothetical protein
MKKLSMILLFGMVALCSCTEIEDELIPVGNLTIEKTIEVPNTPANKLYTIVNDWAVGFFANSNNAVEFRDKEEGIIIGKYRCNFDFETKSSPMWQQILVRVPNKVTMPVEIITKFTVISNDNEIKVKVVPNTDLSNYPFLLKMNEQQLLYVYKSRQKLILEYMDNMDNFIQSLKNFLLKK